MTELVVRGYANGRARRQLILDEATALFGEVGYRAASLREIATRVGISHPGLLHHFPAKQALLLAVLEHRDEVDTERFGFDHLQGLELLRHMVDLVEFNATRPGIVELYCVLSAESTAPDHPAHAFFVERYTRSVTRCAAGFEGARAAGLLRPGIDPDAAGRAFVALMDGLQVQWLFDRDSVDMAAVLRQTLAQLVVAGV
ncbi:TetR family transcriptional regulator [Cellulomonas sp. WB94]|uniref:TetR/AcrR family transcriptional regulator n=1 Tax=Cellulomonas sp. WB94 TaxID=2173174 RepID=UPI000D5848AF|nr:TetR/AcrR family transcriptional regulator [Cellulomonas sp. WB94]PVU82775.1 TetR family transcriptional regulator [Cellulomonas sp. WB94]